MSLTGSLLGSWAMKASHDRRLLVVSALSFGSMFVVMYAMVDVAANAVITG